MHALPRNKFCFTGGQIEMSVQLPGTHNVVGMWPAVWTMGNLGRAGYGASLEGMVSLVKSFRVQRLTYKSGLTRMILVTSEQHQTRLTIVYLTLPQSTGTQVSTMHCHIYLGSDYPDAPVTVKAIRDRDIRTGHT